MVTLGLEVNVTMLYLNYDCTATPTTTGSPACVGAVSYTHLTLPTTPYV